MFSLDCIVLQSTILNYSNRKF